MCGKVWIGFILYVIGAGGDRVVNMVMHLQFSQNAEI